jgi:hypothetical protein
MIKEKFSTLKTVKEKVLLLLKEIPRLRDSDNDLIATYIFNEVGEDIKEMSALDLLAKISKNRLTPFETIRRARIELQKEFEELKGEEFGKRKKKNEVPLFIINPRNN